MNGACGVTKTSIVSLRDENGIHMDNRLEDMIFDIEENYFNRSYMYDTLCNDKKELLYMGSTKFYMIFSGVKTV